MSSPLQRLLVRGQFLHTMDEDQTYEDTLALRDRSAVNLQKRSSLPSSATTTPTWRNWWTPPTRRISNPSLRSETSPKQHHPKMLIRRMPNVTPFLLRLHEHLERYSQHLSDPSVEHSVAAAALLDAGVATASSPRTSPSSTPNHKRSPPLQFFGKQSTQQQQSSHAMALEVEWEAFVSPLLLLAGAEALYGQLEHVMSTPKAHHAPPADLSVLYRTIHKDLKKVKKELCENLLSQPEGRSEQVLEAARTVHVSLNCLQSLTVVRCRLIELQRMLFSTAPATGKDNNESFSTKCMALAESCREFLPDPKQPCGLATSLVVSLQKEVKTWMSLLETMACLEQCRFLETVLAAKKTKDCIRMSSSTTLQCWFRQTAERLLSIMPLFLDCVSTFASPLYGFDRIGLEESAREDKDRLGLVNDYEAEILDFLRRQETKGSSPMAIAIVVDAVGTANQRMEQGVMLDQAGQDDIPDEAERLRREWKTVYIRSTLHSTVGASPNLSRSPSHASSGLFRMSKSSFQNTRRDDDPTKLSPGPTRNMRSIDASALSIARASHNRHVLEYAPEKGVCSWPHSEWHRLVEIILNVDGKVEPSSPVIEGDATNKQRVLGKAATYRPQSTPSSALDDRIGHGTPDSTSQSGWMGNWGAPPPPPPVTSGPTQAQTSTSNFHVIRLGEFVTMLVIAKEEEGVKWQLRRTRGHTDEEVRSFLNEIAPKLRVSTLFDTERISVARAPKGQEATVPGYDLLSIWTGNDHLDEERNAQEFLRSLKASFGLRPQSPLIDSPYKGLFRSGSKTQSARDPRRRSRLRKRRVLSDEESAIAFFLGEDLITGIRK